MNVIILIIVPHEKRKYENAVIVNCCAYLGNINSELWSWNGSNKIAFLFTVIKCFGWILFMIFFFRVNYNFPLFWILKICFSFFLDRDVTVPVNIKEMANISEYLDAGKKLKVLIHGWNANSNHIAMQPVKDAYLKYFIKLFKV